MVSDKTKAVFSEFIQFMHSKRLEIKKEYIYEVLAKIPEMSSGRGTFFADTIELINFKNIKHLKLDLSSGARQIGSWTCLAGINGAGKSSVLQALSLVLMGPNLARELGSLGLSRFCRMENKVRLDAEIRLSFSILGSNVNFFLPLCSEGIDQIKLEIHEEYPVMLAFWKLLHVSLILAYGPNRNLSDEPNRRDKDRHPFVQNQMTLFDPFSHISHLDSILKPSSNDAAQTMIRRLVGTVLGGVDFIPQFLDGQLLFRTQGALVSAVELPDGFRSIIALLVDICEAWIEKNPKGDPDPALISGIIMVDEIDLHLHPRLQRVLVPRLRQAMPNVQWIVTTHSPLVLSSFDSSELVLLDAREPDGVRQLDRQIHGFSIDQIYQWLMETDPTSVVMEEKLSQLETGSKEGVAEDAALLLAQSPNVNEAQARQKLAKRQAFFKEILEKGPK